MGRYLRFVLVLALALATTIARAQSCGCEVSKDRLKTYDQALWLNKRDKKLALEAHLPWGVPRNSSGSTGERLLIQWEMVINYDDDLLVPIWTAHRLTKKDLKAKRTRLECFRRDVRIDKPGAALCADYDEPIYDRGHMVPNGDMVRTERAMINTYMFSNMTPQHCSFNRGIWQILEGLVRHWAENKETIYVITGSVFDRDGNEARDADSAAVRMKARNKKERVAVPSHHYKVLVHAAGGAMDTLTIMLPNTSKKVSADDAADYLKNNIKSIDQIEKLTGITFFPDAKGMGAAEMAKMKQTRSSELWPVTLKKWPTSLDSNCKE